MERLLGRSRSSSTGPNASRARRSPLHELLRQLERHEQPRPRAPEPLLGHRHRRARLAQQQPPQQVQRHRRRAVAHLGARARDVERAHHALVLPVEPRHHAEADPPDRLVRRASARARRCRSGRSPCPRRTAPGRRRPAPPPPPRHRPVALDQLGRHAQQLRLGLVRIRDHAAREVLGGPGAVRQPGRQQPAGARLPRSRAAGPRAAAPPAPRSSCRRWRTPRRRGARRSAPPGARSASVDPSARITISSSPRRRQVVTSSPSRPISLSATRSVSAISDSGSRTGASSSGGSAARRPSRPGTARSRPPAPSSPAAPAAGPGARPRPARRPAPPGPARSRPGPAQPPLGHHRLLAVRLPHRFRVEVPAPREAGDDLADPPLERLVEVQRPPREVRHHLAVRSSAVGPRPPLVTIRSTPSARMNSSAGSRSPGRSPVIRTCASSTPARPAGPRARAVAVAHAAGEHLGAGDHEPRADGRRLVHRSVTGRPACLAQHAHAGGPHAIAERRRRSGVSAPAAVDPQVPAAVADGDPEGARPEGALLGRRPRQHLPPHPLAPRAVDHAHPHGPRRHHLQPHVARPRLGSRSAAPLRRRLAPLARRPRCVAVVASARASLPRPPSGPAPAGIRRTRQQQRHAVAPPRRRRRRGRRAPAAAAWARRRPPPAPPAPRTARCTPPPAGAGRAPGTARRCAGTSSRTWAGSRPHSSFSSARRYLARILVASSTVGDVDLVPDARLAQQRSDIGHLELWTTLPEQASRVPQGRAIAREYRALRPGRATGRPATPPPPARRHRRRRAPATRRPR